MTGMQRFVFIGSGFAAVIYAIYIATVMSANYTPVYYRDIDEAITSTANVIGWTAILAFMHVIFQIALDRIELEEETVGEKAWDMLTTFLPIVTFALVSVYMTGKTPKVAWWPAVYSAVWWIVLASLGVDLYNAWKRGRVWLSAAPAHPPAAHPPGGGAGHP